LLRGSGAAFTNCCALFLCNGARSERMMPMGPTIAKRTLPLLLCCAVAMFAAPTAADAQTAAGQQKPGAGAAPAQTKQQPPKPPAAAKQEKNQPAATQPAPKPAATETAAATSAAVPHSDRPVLIGQYDNWGAYWAAPNGRKICFVAARPNSANTNRGRKPAYLFITSRPHDKVKEEISVIASAPFKAKSDATATIGGKTYAMLTDQDGAWAKNAADEAKLLEAMRKGGELVVKGTTDRGLQSTDVFSMKGLAQALNRIARECK